MRKIAALLLILCFIAVAAGAEERTADSVRIGTPVERIPADGVTQTQADGRSADLVSTVDVLPDSQRQMEDENEAQETDTVPAVADEATSTDPASAQSGEAPERITLSSIDVKKKSRDEMVYKTGLKPAHEKVVYLTFDDGPKQYTPELLDLLEELDVPATFFLVGYAVRAFPENAKMIYDRGYVIGCHTMDHSSNPIKENPDYLRTVFRQFDEEVRVATGDETYTTTLFRFPGGSSSYPYQTKRKVVELGVAWFDWNAMTRDTEPDYSWKDLIVNVQKTTGKDDVVILLMHDGKGHTRQALPYIVAFYRDAGYEFRMLSTYPEELEILSRCPAHMGIPGVE